MAKAAPSAPTASPRKAAKKPGASVDPVGHRAAVGLPEPPEIKTEGGVSGAGKKSGAAAVNVVSFREGKVEEGIEVSRIARLIKDDANLLWIDLSEYSEADLERLAPLLKLHPLTVKATLEDWERPRVDVFDTYFYMTGTVASADTSTRKLEARELNIVFGRNFLLTAHKRPLPFGEEILKRLEQSPELATLHTAYALYIVIDELIEYYEGIFEEIEEEIERTEERALTESSDAFLAELLTLKRYIFALSRFADQHRAVFGALTRPDFTHVSGDEIEPYFRDLQEKLARLVDRLAAAQASVTGAFEIYVSQVAHHTNALIKVLTLISTAVLPAALIVAFFSTSFTDVQPLRTQAAFWIMVAALVVIPGAILLYIRRRHWI